MICQPLYRQQAVGRGRGIKAHGCYAATDFVLGLASPGSFPCPESSPAYSVQFSARAGAGHYLAFGTEWGKLVIVDTRTEARVQRDQHGPVGPGVDVAAHDTSLGRDSESNGSCSRWGVGQPAVIADYRALLNCIFDLKWIKEDRYIALACGDGMCRLHHTETQTEVMVLSGHSGSVKTISANPLEESILLSGSRDGSFALWDTRLRHQGKPDARGLHGSKAAEMVPDGSNPQASFLSPVEKVDRANSFVVDSRKRPRSSMGTGWMEPAKSRNSRGDQVFHRSVTTVEWMPDGQKFMTAGQDGLVKLWDTRYALHPLQQASPPQSKETVALEGERDPGVRPALAPVTSASRSPFSNPGKASAGVGASGFGSKGKRSGAGRVSTGRSPRARGTRGVVEGMERLGRISGGDPIAMETAEGSGRPYGVSSVHACADGSRIAVCTVKSYISVYAYASGGLRNLGSFTGNQNSSSYYIKAKLSPDGTLLASGSTNDAVCLWRVDSPGEPVARLMGHANEVTGVDWCRSEALKLATCSDDETVRVWTLDPRRVARSYTPTAVDPPPLFTPEGGTPVPTAEYGSAAERTLSTGSHGVMPEAGIGGSFINHIAGSIQGKFGPGMACIGENEFWKRTAYNSRNKKMNLNGLAGARVRWPRRFGRGNADEVLRPNTGDSNADGSDAVPSIPRTPGVSSRERFALTLAGGAASPIATSMPTPIATRTNAMGNLPSPGFRMARPGFGSEGYGVRSQVTPPARVDVGTTALTSVFAQCWANNEPGTTGAGHVDSAQGRLSRALETGNENTSPFDVSGENAFAPDSNAMDLPGRRPLPSASNPSVQRLLATDGSEQSAPSDVFRSNGSNHIDHAALNRGDVNDGSVAVMGADFLLKRLPQATSARTPARKPRTGARNQQKRKHRQGLRQGVSRGRSPGGSSPGQRHTLMAFWKSSQGDAGGES